MPPSSSRALSPPLSTVSSAQAPPSPVQVKKVVIQGSSKHDGVSLKMYLKLALAVDNVLPGASVPLFPEHNIRIKRSGVHPLDERSVPYYYPTEHRLLHRTCDALRLGPKSSRPYHTLFSTSSPPLNHASAGSSRRHRENAGSTSTPPNEERHTGYIVVNDYHVTWVLPKEFPPRAQSGTTGGEEEEPSSLSRSAKRPSFFQKTYLYFMAGLKIFVPYVTTPPKGPFLVSISVPRCLDNHVRLRIATPSASTPSLPRGSFTSASSEDETPGWDFLTDPPVSRKVDKLTDTSTYQQSADDSDSDSPSGLSIPGTELILGAYQSTDVLHVRWAPPEGTRRTGIARTEDGMRRVGIERTVGKMRCEVLSKGRNDVRLGITYEGVCTGLWHPGVATMLGMDIALDVKGRRVSWADENAAGWTLSGGNSFGGLYSDASPPGNISRRSSFESTTSTPFLSALNRPAMTPSRGTASLLRAPLPSQNTPDYSFENSPGATPPAATPPSRSSAAYFPATPGQETRLSKSDVSPGKAVTLKINLLKLLPPSQNEFSFSVRGTVLVDVEEEDFVPLPAFRVLGSDKEKMDTLVSSQTADPIIQIGTQLADGPRRTLRLGEEVRCEESVGLVFAPRRSPAAPSPTPSASVTPAKHPTISRVQSRMSSPRIKTEPSDASGTLSTLPCVLTTVTPLPRSAQHTHCVRVNLPAYALDADTIEFGLALPQNGAVSTHALTVEILYARYAGRYVHAEVLPRETDALSPTLSGFDTLAEIQVVGDMQFWVVVHLEDVEADVGAVEVVYLIGDDGEAGWRREKGKGKAKEEIDVDVLLPCFQLPVSRYEVEIECPLSFESHVKYSTLLNQHTSLRSDASKLTQFWLPAGFFPALALSLLPTTEPSAWGRKRSRSRRATETILSTFPQLVMLALLYLVVSMGSEVRQVRDTLDSAARAFVNGMPYEDPDWGDGADLSGKFRWWTQDQDVTTITTEAATSTARQTWEKETILPTTSATPTINLAEATPVREKQSPPMREGRSRAALIPLPAVPLLSWKLPLSPEAKEVLYKGFVKAWHLVRKVWNYPLDPD